MIYTTALQIDLAFDLASIYGVPFAHDDVGEISTLLALALGIDMVSEPTRHDKPGQIAGETKPWRVMRQMQRDDFAQRVGRELIQQSILRHLVPIASVLVSAVWNQIVLRRFAQNVHTVIKQRVAIVQACRSVQLPDATSARMILDGAWLLATADGSLEHQEAVALATLIDSLPLPQRIAVQEASFPDDDVEWFERLAQLEAPARGVLLEVLSYVAVADGELTIPERRFLRRLHKPLECEIDTVAIEAMGARFRGGETAQVAAMWSPLSSPA
jgi:tellurite resistance protein